MTSQNQLWNPKLLINEGHDGNYLRPASLIMTVLSIAFLLKTMVTPSVMLLFPIAAGFGISLGICLLASEGYREIILSIPRFRLLSTLIVTSYASSLTWLHGLTIEIPQALSIGMLSLVALLLLGATLQTFLAVCFAIQALRDRQKAEKEVNNA